MNASKTARERWIVIGIPVGVISAILIVGGMLSREPSAEECLKKAKQLADEDMQKCIRRGEYNTQKIWLARLRRSEKWYRKAIDKGHPDAHSELVVELLALGRRREARQVFLDGANKGFHTAMQGYASLAYSDGEITDEEAYEWLRRAKELGNVDAREILEHSQEGGRRLPFDVARQKWINSPHPAVEEFKRMLRIRRQQQNR